MIINIELLKEIEKIIDLGKLKEIKQISDIEKVMDMKKLKELINPADKTIADTKQLSETELDNVSGGIITGQGAAWLTNTMQKAKANGSTKENVIFLAQYLCGQGVLAQTTPAEAENYVLNNWDNI